MLPSEYFPDHEIVCHCGCGLLPSVEAVERLYTLRLALGMVLPITSAARCSAHNKAAGGKAGSVHLPPRSRRGASRDWGGQAWDIFAKPDLQADILAKAILVGYRGFGFADTYIHIDDAARPQLTYWRY